MDDIAEFTDITFGGEKSKTVMPGEFFATDEITLDIKKATTFVLKPRAEEV